MSERGHGETLRTLLVLSLVMGVWALFLPAMFGVSGGIPSIERSGDTGTGSSEASAFGLMPPLVVNLFLAVTFIGGVSLLNLSDKLSASWVRTLTLSVLILWSLGVAIPWFWGLFGLALDTSIMESFWLSFLLGSAGSFVTGLGRNRMLGGRLALGIAVSLTVFSGLPLGAVITSDQSFSWLLAFLGLAGGGAAFSGLLAQFPSMLWFAIRTPVEEWGPSSARGEEDPSTAGTESEQIFQPVQE